MFGRLVLGGNPPTLQGFGTLGGLEDYQPKLTVRTHQAGKFVTIEIEDNGPGISDEIKDKILQPFFTTKKGTQGTGLGLSITNDIVKAHGGSLSFQNVTKNEEVADKNGTKISILLPLNHSSIQSKSEDKI